MSKLWPSTRFCAFSIALREPLVLDDLALLHAQALHQAGDALRPEDAHQVVLERQVELARRRGRPGGRRGRAAGCRCGGDSWRSVPRMNRPPSGQHLLALRLGLRLDTSRARPRSRFCHSASAAWYAGRGPPADAVRRLGRQRARGPTSSLASDLGVAAEEDVRAAAGHVGGDGDRALAARLGDDVRLALVLLGVQHVVRDALLLEEAGRPPRSSRWRPCRPAPAGPSCAAPRSPWPPPRTSRARSCRRRPPGPCGPSGGWWARRGRRGCRSSRTPRPRCRRCRSCPRASSTCGSSSGTRWSRASGSRSRSSRPPWPRPPGAGRRDQRRPGIRRPVNSSTMITSPSFTT